MTADKMTFEKITVDELTVVLKWLLVMLNSMNEGNDRMKRPDKMTR
jgi:hypothetical protein